MENEEGITEEVEFDPEKRQEWEELKRTKGPFWALKRGERLGVPKQELESFLAETVANQPKNYGLEYNLRKSLSRASSEWGSVEEIEALGQRAYQAAIEAKDEDSIRNIALDVYGKESPEYRDAFEKRKQAVEEFEEGAEEEQLIEIAADATLGDLFEAVNHLWQKGVEVDLKMELWDNFNKDLVEALLSNQGSNIKVIDFFTGYGYSKEDIETYLPVKFV